MCVDVSPDADSLVIMVYLAGLSCRTLAYSVCNARYAMPTVMAIAARHDRARAMCTAISHQVMRLSPCLLTIGPSRCCWRGEAPFSGTSTRYYDISAGRGRSAMRYSPTIAAPVEVIEPGPRRVGCAYEEDAPPQYIECG
jgi:hypothetical protein